jgi:hypothetical protein
VQDRGGRFDAVDPAGAGGTTMPSESIAHTAEPGDRATTDSDAPCDTAPSALVDIDKDQQSRYPLVMSDPLRVPERCPPVWQT